MNGVITGSHSSHSILSNIVKGVTSSLPKAIISGYAPSNIISNRREICSTCEFNKANFCSECSCFIPLKTTFRDSACPLIPPKW